MYKVKTEKANKPATVIHHNLLLHFNGLPLEVSTRQDKEKYPLDNDKSGRKQQPRNHRSR